MAAVLVHSRHSDVPGAGEAGMDGGHNCQVFCTGAGECNIEYGQSQEDITTAAVISSLISGMPDELETKESWPHLHGHVAHQHRCGKRLLSLGAGPAGAHHKPAQAPAGQPDAVPGIRAHSGRQARPITPRRTWNHSTYTSKVQVSPGLQRPGFLHDLPCMGHLHGYRRTSERAYHLAAGCGWWDC